MTAKAMPAPWWRRLAAGVYDLLPLLALWFAVGALAVLLNRGEAIAPAHGPLLLLALLAVTELYLGASFARGGQTLGMRAWRIRIEDPSGRALPGARAYLRAALGMLQLLLLGFGLWWALFDRDRQTLADRLCRSRVVLLPACR